MVSMFISRNTTCDSGGIYQPRWVMGQKWAPAITLEEQIVAMSNNLAVVG